LVLDAWFLVLASWFHIFMNNRKKLNDFFFC